MKTRHASTRTMLWGALVMLLGLPNGAVLGQVINDFDSDLESWRFDFGDGGTIEHDPTEGSPGNPLGAAKLTFNFPGSASAFTGDVFFPAMDLTGAPAVLYDLKVDPSSALDAFGNHGFMQFVSRETDAYTWGNQAGLNLPAVSGWQTFSVSTSGDQQNMISSMAATRAFSLQIFGGPAQNIPDDVVVWLDNIRLVPEPSSFLLLGFAMLGLSLRRGW